MPSLTDLLNDKTTYPDDRKVTLADGVEATLGELRKGYLMETDYRKKTSEVARDREQLQRDREQFQQQYTTAEQTLAKLAEKAVQSGRTTPDEVEEYLQRDPVAKKLMDKLEAQGKQLEELGKRTQAAEQQNQQMAQTWIADQHRRYLAAIKAQDKDLDTDALVAFAQEHRIPRLDLAYRLMTEDRRTKAAIDKAREEERTKAQEEARIAAANPVLPTARRFVPPAPGKDEPKTFEEAKAAASRDPDILAILHGGAGT